MTPLDRPRALLLWPGGLFSSGANFGVPQLLAIAAAMKTADVDVDVVDLDAERGFGDVDIDAILARAHYDLVGISCYSSYDYLKVMELGARVRARLPKAWIATGGYHASARPSDFEVEGSAFDFVIVGDGEGPMTRLASALGTGRRPLLRVLGPESTLHPSKMPPVDWELLARYRPVARQVASQAEIYLSRGCPYDCAFCMERAKRDTSWRALEPAQAVEEMHRLDQFLDLERFTLFIADALFGMKTAWRREFLEALARRPVRARKVWLLVRLDLLEREDIVLFQRANVAPGFGLESGDPGQIKLIRKVGRLSDYLDQMMRVAGWARELDVAWGANVIVGHPGETEQTMRTSARWLDALFNGPGGTTGFLSVDPFRLYPGSPIDEERAAWEEKTGMRVHRYPWWHDGDQDFLAEWVDPSSSLDFRRCHELRHELFEPILRGVAKSFRYQGPAPDYFRRAIDEQIALYRPQVAARTLALDHLWRTVLRAEGTGHVPSGPPTPAADVALAGFERRARGALFTSEDAFESAVREVPRECFVPVLALPDVHRDIALPLDEAGHATVSAMHAYVVAMRELGLAEGDDVVDLGAGSGYGAALAAHVVGARGNVLAIEIDPALADDARAALAGTPNVRYVTADAHDVALWRGAKKVMAGFDLGALPPAFVDALAPGGRLVVPAGGKLLVVDKAADGAVTSRSAGAVVFVRDRSQIREIEGREPAGVAVGEAFGPGA